jgi:DNA transformation protein and related proteins
MSKRSELVELALEQTSSLGTVEAKPMFGGHGIYCDNRIFAIVLDNRLYLKADDQTKADFEKAGSQPFIYRSKGKSMAMSYFEAPPELFENKEAMRFWGQKAVEAANRSKIVSRNRSKRTARGQKQAII